MTDLPERILVRVDYDGSHDGTWLAVSQHEPPIEYTGMEPQYTRTDLIPAMLAEARAKGIREAAKLYREGGDWDVFATADCAILDLIGQPSGDRHE